MRQAYADTSWVVAIALHESGNAALQARLLGFDLVLASNLLEAELRAVVLREEASDPARYLQGFEWITPDRALTREIAAVLDAGYARGADCWHLATALYFAEDPSELTFLTLDRRQAAVAKTLGFAT